MSSSRVPTKRIGGSTEKAVKAAAPSASSPRPKSGQYSVTRSKRPSEDPPVTRSKSPSEETPVTRSKRPTAEETPGLVVTGLADGSVQIEIDGDKIRLSRREARALADKLVHATR